MIQPHHGYSEQEPPTVDRLAVAGRILGIMVAALLMVGGLFLCCSIFYTILNVVKDPSLLASSHQEWQVLLGAGQLVFETPGGTIDAAPLLAIAILGAAALMLANMAIQITLTGGRILPLVMGERKAIKTMLRETLEQHREPAEATVDDDAAKPPRLKF